MNQLITTWHETMARLNREFDVFCYATGITDYDAPFTSAILQMQSDYTVAVESQLGVHSGVLSMFWLEGDMGKRPVSYMGHTITDLTSVLDIFNQPVEMMGT